MPDVVRPARSAGRRPTGGRLVLVRHGESTANAESRFTGRLDVPLSRVGVQQAHRAAALVARSRNAVGRIITSPMVRAAQTAEVLSQDLGIPVERIETAVALVERDYGLLTGMPKEQARARLGPERYLTLRRTLHGRPPAAESGQLAPGTCFESADGPLPPAGSAEALSDVVARVRPWWQAVRGTIETGHDVLVVGHGNSLRALCVLLDDLDPAEVEALNIPPCQPLVYWIGPASAPCPRGGRYLDRRNARIAAAQIAGEGGT